MTNQIGKLIEDSKFKIYHEDKFKDVSFADYKGKWLVVLFYPADFTFVCPTELQEAASFYEEFKKINAEIISVSTDTVFVHKAWHDNSKAIATITYPMAADPTGTLSRLFGTYIDEEGCSLRGTFIIDPDGKLIASDVHSNDIGRSTEEILRKLQAAIYVRENHGEVCPASWKPGKATLKPGVELVGKI